MWKGILLLTLLVISSEMCPSTPEPEEPLLTAADEQSIIENASGGPTCVSRIEVITESGKKAR